MKKKVAIESLGRDIPEILSPMALADYLQYSVKTVYRWLSEGRFDGCVSKRGKHIRIWRDCALEKFFNGVKWQPRAKP